VLPQIQNMEVIFAKLFFRNSFKKLEIILDHLEKEFNNPAFKIVREKIENDAIHFSKNLRYIDVGDIDLKSWVAGHIMNISGDLVESGKYHVYRGVLNSVGPGKNLLLLFDQTVDFTLARGFIDKKKAKRQKKNVRINIENVG